MAMASKVPNHPSWLDLTIRLDFLLFFIVAVGGWVVRDVRTSDQVATNAEVIAHAIEVLDETSERSTSNARELLRVVTTLDKIEERVRTAEGWVEYWRGQEAARRGSSGSSVGGR